MADQLNIGQRLAELALRVYTLALQKGFTKYEIFFYYLLIYF